MLNVWSTVDHTNRWQGSRWVDGFDGCLNDGGCDVFVIVLGVNADDVSELDDVVDRFFPMMVADIDVVLLEESLYDMMVSESGKALVGPDAMLDDMLGRTTVVAGNGVYLEVALVDGGAMPLNSVNGR